MHLNNTSMLMKIGIQELEGGRELVNATILKEIKIVSILSQLIV
jgi:hypothetical protein